MVVSIGLYWIDCADCALSDALADTGVDPSARLLKNLVRQFGIIDRTGEDDSSDHRGPASDRCTALFGCTLLRKRLLDTRDLGAQSFCHDGFCGWRLVTNSGGEACRRASITGIIPMTRCEVRADETVELAVSDTVRCQRLCKRLGHKIIF